MPIMGIGLHNMQKKREELRYYSFSDGMMSPVV